MKENIKKEVIKHGEQLKKVFNLPEETDPIKLCRTVRRYEKVLNQLATDSCNGLISLEYEEKKSEKVLNLLNGVLNFRKQNIPVFYNGDCRGYALKIKDDYVRENNLNIKRDWGGFGLIAPDLSEGF